MKLWFDEDLSPTLVQIAHEHGLEATCNRDRNALGCTDRELRRLVQRDGFVLVTDNASDFRPMYAREHIHPGLIVIPAAHGRARQQHLTRLVIEWIANTAAASRQPPADFMVNKLVQIHNNETPTATDLPKASRDVGQRRS